MQRVRKKQTFIKNHVKVYTVTFSNQVISINTTQTLVEADGEREKKRGGGAQECMLKNKKKKRFQVLRGGDNKI